MRRTTVRSEPDTERLAALTEDERRWLAQLLDRLPDELEVEATTTLVRADRAVTAWLASTVPAGLRALHQGLLPALPRLGIHLHAGTRQDAASQALAAVLRGALGPFPTHERQQQHEGAQ